MIEKIKYLLTGVLALSAVAFVACNDDEEGLNEWTDVAYVFVKGQTLGNGVPKTFTVIETEGLTDATPVVYTFKICLSKVADADVTVPLTIVATGNVADTLPGTMTLSVDRMTIPAGELESEEVTCTIDPTFLAVKDAQGTYDPAVFTVMMGPSVSADAKVKSSTKTNKIVITLNKVVKAYLNLASGTPSNAVNMARTDWSGELGAGVENVITNLWDGTSSDIASNNVPWEFTVDLGATTEMLGFQSKYYASSYAARSIEFMTSSDKSTWKSQGIIATSGATQNLKFLKPVTARYVKHRVLAHGTNGRSSVTEFNVYVAAQ